MHVISDSPIPVRSSILYARPDAAELLRRLCADTGDLSTEYSVAIVVAHPDDETVGAASRLVRLAGAVLVYITDGAPRDRRWWGAPSVTSRDEYASVRREELRAALALAGVAPERTRGLGMVDQKASLDLAGLTYRVAETFRELRPEVVLTQPYEGGHPDHDATAFAVDAGCRLLEREGAVPPVRIEMTSYHVGDGGITPCEFLPLDGCPAGVVELSEGERELKRRMILCFATQQETLQYFPVACECFRVAPCYDFTRPPHSGRLFYEHFDWGTRGGEWRLRAREALRVLGESPALLPQFALRTPHSAVGWGGGVEGI